MGKEGGYAHIVKDINTFSNLHTCPTGQSFQMCITVHELRNNRNFCSKLEAEVEK